MPTKQQTGSRLSQGRQGDPGYCRPAGRRLMLLLQMLKYSCLRSSIQESRSCSTTPYDNPDTSEIAQIHFTFVLRFTIEPIGHSWRFPPAASSWAISWMMVRVCIEDTGLALTPPGRQQRRVQSF